MASPHNGGPRTYAVRLASSAGRELQEEHSRLAGISDLGVADDWRDGVREAVRGLATYPERCTVVVENRLFPDGVVHQLPYRRRRGPFWRILFTVHEADENDPPTVRVHHIRHGARAPMTEWPTEDE